MQINYRGLDLRNNLFMVEKLRRKISIWFKQQKLVNVVSFISLNKVP